MPKICWKAVGRRLAFSLVPSGTFLTAPASFISAGDHNALVLAYLCSNVGKYFIYRNSDTTGAGDIMLNIQSLIKFPIPYNLDNAITMSIKGLVEKKLSGENVDEMIERLIYSSYDLNEEEIQYIESL